MYQTVPSVRILNKNIILLTEIFIFRLLLLILLISFKLSAAILLQMLLNLQCDVISSTRLLKYLQIYTINIYFTNLDFILFSISKTYLFGVLTQNAWKSGLTGGSGSCNINTLAKLGEYYYY